MADTTTARTETGEYVVITKTGPGKLTWRDAAKGGMMAVGMAALTTLQQLLSNGADELMTAHAGQTIGLAALGGLITYLLKNFLTEQHEVKPA